MNSAHDVDGPEITAVYNFTNRIMSAYGMRPEFMARIVSLG